MATCIKPLSTFTCSNSASTTCVKQANTVYVVSASTTCSATEFAVLKQADYNNLLALVAGQPVTASTNTAQTNNIAALQTQVNALLAGAVSATINNGQPNPEVLQAEGILFGAVFVAATLIWGTKRVMRVFSHTSET